MDYPPSKRHRGLDLQEDPFGDDDYFSQADLDEIDVIASQATGDPRTSSKPTLGGTGSKPTLGGTGFQPTLGGTGSKPTLGGTSFKPTYGGLYQPGYGEADGTLSLGKARTNQTRDYNVPPGNSSTHRETFVNGQQCKPDRGQLEAQHAELKRKLKEVEEEIMVRNGEIRVLRDSLRGAQQEKEAQRRAQLLLEKEKQKEQSDKEKELTKKVQCLQSDLHFKEAEMNEMKLKLQSSERSSRAVGSPLPRNSPRVLSSVAQMHHGSSSSSFSPAGSGFITKETFSAQLSVKTEREDRPVSSSRLSPSHTELFLWAGRAQHQHTGSILLRLLLQQPLPPSSLGLCHLLCVSPDALPAPLNSYLSLGLSVGSSSSPGQEDTSVFNQKQSLAVAGLNMMSLPQPVAVGTRGSNRSCPGAVHLLSLLDHHLARFCHHLDSVRTSQSSSGTTTGSGPDFTTSSSPACEVEEAGGVEEAGAVEEAGGVGIEEFGLASLRVLSLLLAHSDEAVEAVLSEPSPPSETEDKAKAGVSNRKTTTPADAGLQSQHAVLQWLLQLCEPGFSSGSSQRDVLVQTALKTLCILVDRTPPPHTHRLRCVFSRETLSACLSVDLPIQTVSDCVSILESAADHDQLAELLCSQHESCLFLKLFHYIRIRPDGSTTESQWVLLDLQVVRLLSRVFCQRAKSWTCQCYTELVQSIVVLFHRQWLDIRVRETCQSDSQTPPDRAAAAGVCAQPWWCGPGVELLRETLLLLHWLLFQHRSFAECCRPVLHMYGQVIPAVKKTLKRLPDLSESEEMALEEICRDYDNNTEDVDTDMDTDT